MQQDSSSKRSRGVQAAIANITDRVVTRVGVARASKFAALGALLVLGATAIVPIGGAIRNELAVEGLRNAGQEVLVLDRLHQSLLRQQGALSEHTNVPLERRATAFRRESAGTTRLLRASAPRLAGSVRLHARVIRMEAELVRRGNVLVGALRGGDAAGVRQQRGVLDARADTLHGALDHIEKLAVERGDRRAQDLEGANQTTIVAMPIAFGVGVLLLALMWMIGQAAGGRAAGAFAELALLSRQLTVDSLTGLPNERAFAEDFHRPPEGDDAREVMSLIRLDVDRLKHLNDTRGHRDADERLKRVALCAREISGGRAYRMAGAGFVIELPGRSAWEAFELAQDLHEELRSATPPIGVTAGVGESEDGQDRAALLHRADVALIAAKASRRSAVVYSRELELVAPDDETEADRRHAQTLATALARAVDAKDPYTRSHCETVSALCGLIGEELGLAPERLRDLRLAGLLHDVGKIGVGDDILLKPGKLTDEEFEVMKSHSTIGHRIVMGAALEEQAHSVLHHHERPDGRGYPDGLSGDEIPLESRIILVADAFEAMISDRPYRRGRPEADALAELDRCAGTQFDPNCVTALHRVLERSPVQAGNSQRDELAAA
jgi:diguanylate cyclase (GGDEF)-like protein